MTFETFSPLNRHLQGLSIFLIGMMGSGKTTIGQLLAHQLGYRFFDTDVLIERVTGITIPEIFATEGEEYFRNLETQVLEQISAYTKSVIATGGGMIIRQQNWSYLRHGLIIWLDAPVDVLVSRLESDQTRPLLQNSDLTTKLTKLLLERSSRYAQADLQITMIINQTAEEIITEILDRIPTVIKPKPINPSELISNNHL